MGEKGDDTDFDGEDFLNQFDDTIKTRIPGSIEHIQFFDCHEARRLLSHRFG
jgi:hypothetical protein